MRVRVTGEQYCDTSSTHAPARELLQVDGMRILARRGAAELAVEIDAPTRHPHLDDVMPQRNAAVV